MDIDPSLGADGQTPERAEPRQGALYDPTVPPELGAALDPAPGDAGPDASAGQGSATMAAVVAIVGMKLRGPLTGSAPDLPDGRHGINHPLQHGAVVNVGFGEPQSVLCLISGDGSALLEHPISAGLLAVALVVLVLALLATIRIRRDEVFVQ